jgi:hypothetical protein
MLTLVFLVFVLFAAPLWETAGLFFRFSNERATAFSNAAKKTSIGWGREGYEEREVKRQVF